VASALSIDTTGIDGLLVLSMKHSPTDERGLVREFFRSSAWTEAGLPDLGPWRQINVTESLRGAVRGLHGEDMTKLVAVVMGEAFGAYVDTRAGSPTFGAVVTVPLVLGRQVLVPRGVCNGYQSLTDTQYVYCFDNEWAPGMAGVAVSAIDPALAIEWPITIDPSNRAQLSEKDANLPTFAVATQTAAR
jgi:dTDP-4-dehydrorhamnose 3,5-epimerase